LVKVVGVLVVGRDGEHPRIALTQQRTVVHLALAGQVGERPAEAVLGVLPEFVLDDLI